MGQRMCKTNVAHKFNKEENFTKVTHACHKNWRLKFEQIKRTKLPYHINFAYMDEALGRKKLGTLI